jgi:hypothetical protein
VSETKFEKGSIYIESQVLQALESQIVECGNAKKFADKYDLSPQFVSDVRLGRRSVTKALASRLGFKKEAIFVFDGPPLPPVEPQKDLAAHISTSERIDVGTNLQSGREK